MKVPTDQLHHVFADKGTVGIPEERANALAATYENTGEDLGVLFNDVSQLTDDAIGRGYNLHMANLGRLGLDTAETREYFTLVADPTRFVESVSWLAGKVCRVMSQPRPFRQVTFESVGDLLFGNKQSEVIDDYLDWIAVELPNIHPDVTVEMIERDKRDPMRRVHQFFPYRNDPHGKNGPPDLTFTKGRVRMREPLADFLLPGGVYLDFYRQAEAMLALNRTDDVIRDVLEPLQHQEMTGEEQQKATPEVAHLTGMAYERAMRVADDKRLDIITIRDQLLIKAHKLSELMPG